MPECEKCEREISEEEYSEQSGICNVCVMAESMNYGVKSVGFVCIFFIGSILSILMLFGIFTTLPFAFFDLYYLLAYFLPLLILFLISAAPALGYLIHIIKKIARENRDTAIIEYLNSIE